MKITEIFSTTFTSATKQKLILPSEHSSSTLLGPT